jgi:hypothetical protein
MIILRSDWYTLAALVALTEHAPAPTDAYADWLLWERTCFPFGTVKQVADQVRHHYRYDAAPWDSHPG